MQQALVIEVNEKGPSSHVGLVEAVVHHENCPHHHPDHLLVIEINERCNEECLGQVEHCVHYKNTLFIFPLDASRVY